MAIDPGRRSWSRATLEWRASARVGGSGGRSNRESDDAGGTRRHGPTRYRLLVGSAVPGRWRGGGLWRRLVRRGPGHGRGCDHAAAVRRRRHARVRRRAPDRLHHPATAVARAEPVPDGGLPRPRGGRPAARPELRGHRRPDRGDVLGGVVRLAHHRRRLAGHGLAERPVRRRDHARRAGVVRGRGGGADRAQRHARHDRGAADPRPAAGLAADAARDVLQGAGLARGGHRRDRDRLRGAPAGPRLGLRAVRTPPVRLAGLGRARALAARDGRAPAGRPPGTGPPIGSHPDRAG